MSVINNDQVLIEYHSKTGSLDVSGYWQTFKGGKTSVESRKTFNGGSKTPVIVSGARPNTENITVDREFDPVVDGPILRQARGGVGSEEGTMSVRYLDSDLLTVGEADVYTVRLVDVTPPEGDVTSSGTGARYTLEFVVSSVA